MRLFKDIDHVMQTTFAVSEEDALKLLPKPFLPFVIFGRGLLQIGALRYRDLIFEGRSLGPCTDVYVAIGVEWKDRLYGYNVAFFNNSEHVVEVVNKNWFFGKKLADVSWDEDRGKLQVQVDLHGRPVLNYQVSAPPSGLIVPLPVMPKIERALTISNGRIYSFDNIFCSNFGCYAWPEVYARNDLDWLESIGKTQVYSLIWFDDILRVADAKLAGYTEPSAIKNVFKIFTGRNDL